MNANLVMISGSSCAGCANLHMEVKEVLKQFPELTYKELSIDTKNEEVMHMVDQYHIDKIPTLLLLKGNEEIGRVSGYQPSEILQYWLEDKLK